MTLRPRSRDRNRDHTMACPGLGGHAHLGQPAIFMAPNCTALPSPVPRSTHRPAEYDRASAVIIIKLLLWHTNRLYCSRVIVRQCFQLVVSLPAPPPPTPRALCLLLLHFAQMKNVAVYFHLEFFYCGGGSGSSDGALNIICCINVGHMHMKIGNTQRTHTHIYTKTPHIHGTYIVFV